MVHPAQAILARDAQLRVLDLDVTITKGDVRAGLLAALADAAAALRTEKVKTDGGGPLGNPGVDPAKLDLARQLMADGRAVAGVVKLAGVGKMTQYRHGIAGKRLPRHPKK